MPEKFCFCVPLKLGYNIVGVVCCINVIIGIAILFSILSWGVAISISFGIPSAFWLISQFKTAIIHKKIFAYTFLVSTILFETGSAIVGFILINILADENKAIWPAQLVLALLLSTAAAFSIYLFTCLISFVKL